MPSLILILIKSALEGSFSIMRASTTILQRKPSCRNWGSLGWSQGCNLGKPLESLLCSCLPGDPWGQGGTQTEASCYCWNGSKEHSVWHRIYSDRVQQCCISREDKTSYLPGASVEKFLPQFLSKRLPKCHLLSSVSAVLQSKPPWGYLLFFFNCKSFRIILSLLQFQCTMCPAT